MNISARSVLLWVVSFIPAHVVGASYEICDIEKHIQYCEKERERILTVCKELNSSEMKVNDDVFKLCRVNPNIRVIQKKNKEDSRDDLDFEIEERFFCNFHDLFEKPEKYYDNEKGEKTFYRLSFWQSYSLLCSHLSREVTLWQALRIYFYMYPEAFKTFISSRVFQVDHGLMSWNRTSELYSLLITLLCVFFPCDRHENTFYLTNGIDKDIGLQNEKTEGLSKKLKSVGMEPLDCKSQNRNLFSMLKDKILQYLTVDCYKGEMESDHEAFTDCKVNKYLYELQKEYIKEKIDKVKKFYEDEKITHKKNTMLCYDSQENIEREINAQEVDTLTDHYFNCAIQENYLPIETIQALSQGEEVVCKATPNFYTIPQSSDIFVDDGQEFSYSNYITENDLVMAKNNTTADGYCSDDENKKCFTSKYNRRVYKKFASYESNALCNVNKRLHEINTLGGLINKKDWENTLFVPFDSHYTRATGERLSFPNRDMDRKKLYFNINLLDTWSKCSDLSIEYFNIVEKTRKKMIHGLNHHATIAKLCSVFAMKEGELKGFTLLTVPFDEITLEQARREYDSVNYALEREINILQTVTLKPDLYKYRCKKQIFEIGEVGWGRFFDNVNSYNLKKMGDQSKCDGSTLVSYFKPKRKRFHNTLIEYKRLFKSWMQELVSILYFSPQNEYGLCNDYTVLDGSTIRSKVIQSIYQDDSTFNLQTLFHELNFNAKQMPTVSIKTILNTDDICEFLSLKACQEKYRGRTKQEMIELETIGWECKGETILLPHVDQEVGSNWDDNGISKTSIIERRNNANCFCDDPDEGDIQCESTFQEKKFDRFRDCDRLRRGTFTGGGNSKGVRFCNEEANYLAYIGFIESLIPQMIQCVYCENCLLKQSRGRLSEDILKSCHNNYCPSLKKMENPKSRKLMSGMIKSTVSYMFSLRNLLNVKM